VMTARPELIKQIFSQPASHYSPFAAKGIAALTGERSVFQLRDQEHRRHRRLMMPPFHGSRMRAYAHAMQRTAREVFTQAADSGPVKLHTLTQKISLDIILQTVFGVQEPERVLQREFGGIGPFARFRRVWEHLDELLRAQVDHIRENPGGTDVLSMLLEARDPEGEGLDDQEIRDELRTLLFAGHETTAIALCWVVDLVGRHPAVAERLIDELMALGPDAEPEEIAKVPYLEAICNEALRLYPIVTEVLRTLHEPLELGEYQLEPPFGVSASILGVHRNEELYPEPETFRPERFIEHKFGPHEFIPFGGGHRRCIGAAFAGFEMRIVIGTLLREFGVKLMDPQAPKPVRRSVTLGPSGGVPVQITAAGAGTVSVAA